MQPNKTNPSNPMGEAKAGFPLTVTREEYRAASLLAARRRGSLRLLPAAVMFLLPLFKVPIKWAMAGSIAVSAALAVAVQGFTPGQVLLAAWEGYHPADRALPPVEPPYRVRRTYRYGKIGLTLICRSGDQENEE